MADIGRYKCPYGELCPSGGFHDTIEEINECGKQPQGLAGLVEEEYKRLDLDQVYDMGLDLGKIQFNEIPTGKQPLIATPQFRCSSLGTRRDCPVGGLHYTHEEAEECHRRRSEENILHKKDFYNK